MKDKEIVEKLVNKMEIYEILPQNNGNHKSSAFLHKLFPEFNMLGIKMISDNCIKEVNMVSLEKFIGHYPAGTSFKSIKHFK